ncbi:MAG: ABC transporter substrate-binding protein [Anaerolineales bacterium]|jgi:NitT/TauT family transport system substrate-binding protein
MKSSKFILVLILALLASSCAPGTGADETPAELTHVRLPMGYVPNVQYAPFYTAVDKGFYAEEGIELEFDYSYETDGVALVGANELQFSLVSGEQVPIARAEGIPIVYVMAWYAEYPIAVIAKSDQNLKTPEDLAGKRIGLPGLFGANYVGLRALMGYAGLKESDLTLESIGFTQVEALAAGTSPVVVGYIANEPVQLEAQGYDLDILRVSDYLELVSNGLITNETTIAENPDLVRRMIRATLRGIQYAVEHPQEAYEHCLNHVDGLADADQEVQFQVLESSLAIYQTDPYGYSSPQAWSNMQDVLLDMGLMKSAINLEEAYSNDFIQ